MNFILNNEFHSEWNLRFDLRWRNGFLEFRFGPDAASSSPKTRFSVHIAHRILEYFGRDASGANRLSYSQVRSGRKFIKSDDRSLKRREMEISETLTIPRMSSVQLTWTSVAISGWWWIGLRALPDYADRWTLCPRWMDRHGGRSTNSAVGPELLQKPRKKLPISSKLKFLKIKCSELQQIGIIVKRNYSLR